MHPDVISPFRPHGEPNVVARAVAVGFAVACVLYAGIDWKRGADERLRRSVEPAPARTAAAAPTPRSAAAAAPAARSAALPALPTLKTIYRCKGGDGANFWSDAPCRDRRATTERMTTVPAGLPFEQQVAIARGAAEDAAWLYRPNAKPAFRQPPLITPGKPPF